jgi:hypothetical protein
MATVDTILDLDVRLLPSRTARQEFHDQIARLEHALDHALSRLDPARRPSPPAPAAVPTPRILTSEQLEAARDALMARLTEVEDRLAQQSADHTESRALLKRMNEAPAHFRWTTVTTKDLGVEGCRSWQSVPMLGPIGMLGNWWRVRMSSGCP